MTSALSAIACAVVAAAATRLALGRLIPATPLRRANYRGIPVPTGLGITVLAGIIGAVGLLALLHGISPHSSMLADMSYASLVVIAGAAGFGLLGLFDDIASSSSEERGIRAHMGALGKGRLTSGALKLLAGSALALGVAGPGSSSFGYVIAGGAVVALSANLFNALDVRPGRCGKTFLLAAIPMAIAGGAFRPVISAALGAAAAFLPADVRERAMLGDTGSNALGAIVGVGIVYLAPPAVELIALLALAALTLVAEGPTLSKGIHAIPPLRALDEWGRAPETSAPQN